ncbi:MAG: GntR family transcriptional regulator [Clostridiales bacterium]|nr:GntR family transcriptional regulator [Clostridiales bacterium]
MKKYIQLYNLLKEQITQNALIPGTQLPTEHAIAAKYQVSRQTVRQALDLLRRDGYISSVQGSGSYVNKPPVSSPKTRQIAVICTYISEYIFPSILRGVENVTKEKDYQLLINSTNNSIASERSILSKLADNPVDGIIVEGTKTALPNPNREFYFSLAAKGIPIVFINGFYPDVTGENVIHLVTDDYAGGYLATSELIRAGHRNICGIFKSDDRQGTERYSGYMDAIVRLGAEVRDNNVIWFTTESKDMLYRSICDLLNKTDRTCTGAVCYNDQIASTVIRCCESREGNAIRAVASFDQCLGITSETIGFVSYPHPREKMGTIAAEKLFNMISGRHEESVVFPWE